MARKLYRKLMDPKDALELLLDEVKLINKSPIGSEEIKTVNAGGRIASKNIIAKITCPNFQSSAMDGYALVAKSTKEASVHSPLRINKDKFIEVDTGDFIPHPFDCVVMVEKTRQNPDGSITIFEAMHPGENIRLIGEDFNPGEIVVYGGQEISTFEIMSLLATGNDIVTVNKRPRAVIIATGDEITNSYENLDKNMYFNFNGPAISYFLKEHKAIVEETPILPDNIKVLQEYLNKYSEFDLILMIGGSSFGRDDYTASILEENGKLLAHGVYLRPGKPVILGSINKSIFIGLPGYSAACAVILDYFVKPVLNTMTGKVEFTKKSPVSIYKPITSSSGEEERIRGQVAKIKDKIYFYPLNRSSSSVSSLLYADGICILEKGIQGSTEQESFDFIFWRKEDLSENSIVVLGSNDPLLPYISSKLYKDFKLRIVSSPSGSLAGIASLKDGLCHVAATHLFDSETGEYNIPFILKYFDKGDTILVMLAYRQQGMMVKKGNPFNVQSLEDIVSKGLRIVNRQKGAGTRVLLDYEMNKLGIKPSQILGYENEVFTHYAAATSILSSVADVAFGIQYTADFLGLDFIPWKKENFELCICKNSLNDPKILSLIDLIKSKSFIDANLNFSGYDFSDTGKIREV
ncbi:molybdopterin molybdochelatase [Thermodesulfobium acidiphilum]|uniref:Molybdopterin molybdenumtransferase n=1 Tax=Thermodesulfobium acidiphilum TaxID=1794699 RepID=A0A2R4W0P2_THEAF|nr:molybdopterin biosynthesis protein [Thermodesulfobium acidiphilum]AWB10248.1 molybdopterin molybdochelatase [Thermodesulfobium acidiphilum]